MELETRVHWAKEHRWYGGQSLRRLQTTAYALWLVLDGHLDLTLRDWSGPLNEWHLTAGDAFLAPAPCVRDVVAAKPTGAHWLTLGLQVSAPPGRTEDIVSRLSPPFLWRPSDGDRASLTSWMRSCVAEDERATELSRYLQASLAGAAFALCWRARLGDDGTPLADALRQRLPLWLAELLQEIETEPQHSLAERQKQIPVSPSHLRRVFHSFFGVSPQTYLTSRRLEAAKSLLERTDLSAGIVASSVGFESQAHFTRLFKETFGMTPIRFRRQSREQQI